MTAGVQPAERGITLIEMVIVVAIIGVMAGVTFPSITAGLDSIRLNSATRSTASFLAGALNLAERRQVVMELTVARKENRLALHSPEPGFERTLAMPDGIHIAKVVPERPGDTGDEPLRVYLMPGGTAPRIGVVLATARGARRMVEIDPITGLPKITRPNDEQ